MSKITYDDYKSILNYYNTSIPKSKRLTKIKAERILSLKLCRCIKKIGKIVGEERSIGTCTKSIFNKKGYTRGKFKCKKKRTIKFRKTEKTLKKTLKNKL